MFGYVYMVTNTINGVRYIGQRKGRFDCEYKGSGKILKLALKKYGKDKFDVTLLSSANTAEMLNELEIWYISIHNAAHDDNYYNIAIGGNNWGSSHTKETREKISKSCMGRPAPNKGIPNTTQRERMISNNPMKNPEISKKVSIAQMGKVPYNKISETFDWSCETCGAIIIRRDTANERKKRFCNKSCAATYSNTNRTGYKIKKCGGNL